MDTLPAILCSTAAQWGWSSAAAHSGADLADPTLEMDRWRKRWTAPEWSRYLTAQESQTELTALRHCTHTGRPLGTPDFVAALEKSTLRLLAPRQGGRPKNPSIDPKQSALGFVA